MLDARCEMLDVGCWMVGCGLTVVLPLYGVQELVRE
jgi:hypothetical protein